MSRPVASLAIAALIGACGQLTANTDTTSSTSADGGTSAADAGTDAAASDASPTCGVSPFDDGFDGADPWETDHAPYGPQEHISVEPDVKFARSAPRSLVTTITPDNAPRASSYQTHVQGTATGCVELRFALHVERAPISSGGGTTKAVTIATIERSDGSFVAVLLQSNGTLLLQEASDQSTSTQQFSASTPSPDLAPGFSEVVLRFETDRATLSVDSRTIAKPFLYAHGGTFDVVRIGCRFADADVTTTYAIDDVSIR